MCRCSRASCIHPPIGGIQGPIQACTCLYAPAGIRSARALLLFPYRVVPGGDATAPTKQLRGGLQAVGIHAVPTSGRPAATAERVVAVGYTMTEHNSVIAQPRVDAHMEPAPVAVTTGETCDLGWCCWGVHTTAVCMIAYQRHQGMTACCSALCNMHKDMVESRSQGSEYARGEVAEYVHQ